MIPRIEYSVGFTFHVAMHGSRIVGLSGSEAFFGRDATILAVNVFQEVTYRVISDNKKASVSYKNSILSLPSQI
jgi:hypothetical protein